MTGFISYYWLPETLSDATSLEAYKLLASKNSNTEQKVKAFEFLLKSKDPVAQGIAFDYFFYNESLNRFGCKNIFSTYRHDLLIEARKQLNNPPILSKAPSGTFVTGANYCSALGVLTHLGEEKDIESIANVLETSSENYVVFACCMVIQRLLGLTKKYYSKIVSTLIQIVYNEQLPENIRIMAVRAFANYKIPEIDNVLVDICKMCGLPISAYAALILGDRNLEQYRNLLHQLTESWAIDALYPASEVRDILKLND